MEIWLSNGTKDKLKIPVNPEEIGQSDTRNFEDIVLANGDEKTVISGRNLREYELASFFPARLPYYAQTTSFKAPIDYVHKIQGWMNAKKVLLFQVTGTVINENITIRSFEWKEVGGAVGDIEYTLQLKEHRPVSYAKYKSSGNANNTKPPKRPPAPSSKPRTYIVKKDDCLWDIAKKYYGSAEDWRKIYNKNKAIIGKNPNLIYPGQRLVIP